MTYAPASLFAAFFRRGQWLRQLLLGLAGIVLAVAIAAAAFLLHSNLSAIGFVFLFVVVLIAHRWGLLQATIVSVAAVFCLNYLFVPPLFEFQVADPENWVALVTFETAALLVSGLSSKLRTHAEQVELERARTAKLYQLSRAILLIDGRSSTSEQLSALIRELVQVEAVDLWVIYEGSQPGSVRPSQLETGSALETYLADTDSDDPELRVTSRVLRLGTTSIGAMVLRGWEPDLLLADAVASLAAVAIERARALQKETQAEAERNSEQLRTAVLDALAHGFKTPLTAIQTASSGLLAIDHMTTVQAELVTIIDEQATMLGQLTTRLLQTAALEAREMRLRRSKVSILSLLEVIREEQDKATRDRIRLLAFANLREIEVDAHLIQLALAQLIDNAAKYSPGGSMIDVTVVQGECGTTVEVANGGSAIRLEERERIFERFYRGLDAAHGPSGTGLGLSIVKKTAEAHGGRAWVELDNDTTRFFLLLAPYNESE